MTTYNHLDQPTEIDSATEMCCDGEIELGAKTVLLISAYFPPGTSSGTMRTVKFAEYLPDFGWTPVVLTMNPEAYHPNRIDPTWVRIQNSQLRVYRTPVWMPDRTLSRWYKRLHDMGRSKAAGEDSNSPLNPGRGPEQSKRPWPIRVLRDWLHFPDDYGGWLIPGILEGRRIMRREKIDVVYSTSPSTVTHLIAMRLKRFTNLPWIADFRDPWEVLFPECVYLDENRLKRAAEIRAGERVVASADLVITNTDRACSAYQKRFPYLPATKFVTLPNGFDPQDFENIPHTNSEGPKLTIMYAGTFFADLRSPNEILEAVTELVNEGRLDPDRFVLKIVGSSSFTQPETPVIEVIPRVSHSKSLRMMAESDILLLLQQSEKYRLQIPAKTYEYMAAQKWILAIAPEGATADLVRRMPNGMLVLPGHREDLKNAILHFYRLFLEKRLYPVPQDEILIRSFRRRDQTRVLAEWLDRASRNRKREVRTGLNPVLLKRRNPRSALPQTPRTY